MGKGFTDVQKQSMIEEAMALRTRLFDIANAFDGEETGHIASELHQACNHIGWANQSFSTYLFNNLEKDGDRLAVMCIRRGADRAAVAAWPDIKRLEYIQKH